MVQPNDHPAARAWKKIRPLGKLPAHIESLKEKRKIQVVRLKGIGPDGQDIIAKGGFIDSLKTEQLIYQEILPHCSCSALQCYGLATGEGEGFSWLFLEDAGGAEFDRTDKRHWQAAEEWLGQLHTSILDEEKIRLLPRRELNVYRDYVKETRAHLLDNLSNPRLGHEDASRLKEAIRQLDRMADKWDDIQSAYDGVPCSLIHGDLKLKNARIRQDGAKISFLPFDWEMGGWGASLIDLGVVYLESPEKDLPTYWSMLRHLPPYQRMDDFHALLYLGGLLRLVVATYWVGNSLQAGYLVRLMGKIDAYNRSFSRLFRLLGWM